MSGIHEIELTDHLVQIKEATSKLEALCEDMRAALIQSIISNQDTSALHK